MKLGHQVSVESQNRHLRIGQVFEINKLHEVQPII